MFKLWYIKRGQHNIELEIQYPENPRFIFHDSRGIEAGSVEELEKLKDFIFQRANETKVKDQLHAIWYGVYYLLVCVLRQRRFCIPTDDSRCLLPAEMSIFDLRTGIGESRHLEDHGVLVLST